MLETGAMVGGYRIDGVLGEGGMGAVYRATQLSLQRVVALKVLTGDLSHEPGFRERFRREGKRQAAMDHPHIVSVYEAGETDDGLFLAMRLVEGPTLKALLLAGQIDHQRCLRVLTQVADALDAAHAEGLIHRDVKPQNILIGAGDHAYLADFGLTKGSDEDVLLTEPGYFVGTIDYISPEQARGEPATPRSDVYSLCCVLHECLTGEVPFPRPSEPSVLYAHLTVAPPRVTGRHPDLPAALDAVIATGMAKDPDARPPSAGALVLDARRAFAAHTPLAPSDRTRIHRAAPATPHPAQAAVPPLAPAAPPAVASPPAEAPDPAPTKAAPPAVASPPAEAPDPPPTAATPSPAVSPRPGSPRAGRPARALTLAGLLLVLAAVAGAVAGGSSSGGTAAPPLSNSASAGPLELSFPAGWQRVQGAPQIPGLALANPLVLAPPGGAGAGARLEAGTDSAAGPTLLPDGFVTRLPAPPAPRDLVLIGGTLQALRYVGLQPKGATGPLTLYVVPTTQGVLTLACSSAPAPVPADFARQCARVVASARLVGATAYPVGPSPAYAGQLRVAAARLDSARRTAAGRLGGAASARAQSAAERELAAAYAGASRAVASASSNPVVAGVGGQVSASLAAIGRAYQASAVAAAGSDPAAYAAAARSLARGEADLARGMAGLRTLGYLLSG